MIRFETACWSSATASTAQTATTWRCPERCFPCVHSATQRLQQALPQAGVRQHRAYSGPSSLSGAASMQRARLSTALCSGPLGPQRTAAAARCCRMLLLPCAPTRAAETNKASRSCDVVGAGSLEIHRPATSAAQTRREERRLGLCSMLPPLLHRWLELSRTADGRRCRVLSRLQLCAQTLRALGTPRSRAGRRIMRWSAQAKRRAQARRSHAHQRRGPCLQHAHLVPLLAHRTSPAIVVVASAAGAVARAAQRAAVECIQHAGAALRRARDAYGRRKPASTTASAVRRAAQTRACRCSANCALAVRSRRAEKRA